MPSLRTERGTDVVVDAGTGDPDLRRLSEDEAVRDVNGLPPVQPDDWPVAERLTWADT